MTIVNQGNNEHKVVEIEVNEENEVNSRNEMNNEVNVKDAGTDVHQDDQDENIEEQDINKEVLQHAIKHECHDMNNNEHEEENAEADPDWPEGG